MLRFLSVRNLAVITQLEVEFEPGLNVLSGETGAGKSMLVLAIDLMTGGRASADMVRTGEDVATVQAIFEKPDGREVIVRREISAQGRSRAFIDDTLATSAALRELGSNLVDLHGQHEHQALLDPAEHIALLDNFADLGPAVEALGARFDDWRAAAAALERTSLSEQEKKARADMASFHLQEIDRVAPKPDEDTTLAAERTVLANADKLSRLSSEAYASLYDGDTAVLAQLATVWRKLADLAELDARVGPYLDRRDEIKAQLEDIAFFLRSYDRDLDASPERLQSVEDRLAAIDRLKRKHGPTLADVLQRRQALADELSSLELTEERAAELEKRVKETASKFLAEAARVSNARKIAGRALARTLEGTLAELAMPKSRLDVRLQDVSADSAAWTRAGTDVVEFYLSPNPGEELRPLAKIASGGELSRIMLALRTLGGADAPGRTLVFDEVDAGIGGEAADAVGARLQGLGDRFQVLCVTHLPQIAARGNHHFQIAKRLKGGRTETTVARLDDAGREMEIARMIAGAEVSKQVLASARELLTRRRESEDKTKAKGRRRGT